MKLSPINFLTPDERRQLKKLHARITRAIIALNTANDANRKKREATLSAVERDQHLIWAAVEARVPAERISPLDERARKAVQEDPYDERRAMRKWTDQSAHSFDLVDVVKHMQSANWNYGPGHTFDHDYDV